MTYHQKSDLLQKPTHKRQLLIYPKDTVNDIRWPSDLGFIKHLADNNSLPEKTYRQRIGDDKRLEITLCPIDFTEFEPTGLTEAISGAITDDDRELDIVFINHPEWTKEQLISFYSAIGDAFYNFSENKAKKPAEAKVHIDDNQISDEDWALAMALIEGRKLYKDLGNRPGNICTPRHFEEVATELGKTLPLDIKVLDEDEMTLMGMQLLLAVAKGSAQPARLIKFEYNGNPKDDEHIALVGKGITFDTGGISIKPSANMEAMTMDMLGASTVFGIMYAVAKSALHINIKGYVAAAENMPSATAYKPGDVYTAMNGISVEIKNTDAEGRLILADALQYACTDKPKLILDFATLTGACLVALGHHRAAIITNNTTLGHELVEAGEPVGDLAWQLPNDKAYHKLLESKVADICHIGGRNAGTITAGCFLQKFVNEDIDWAHFDIAGVAFGPHSGGRPSAKPMNLVFNYLLKQIDNG